MSSGAGEKAARSREAGQVGRLYPRETRMGTSRGRAWPRQQGQAKSHRTWGGQEGPPRDLLFKKCFY